MDRIILIAQQLSKEGKNPNTALIKARLPKNTPLPMIIQGLKLWQDNPNKEIINPSEPAISASLESENKGAFDLLLEQKIEQMIKPLLSEINLLKDQISQLKKNS